MRARALAVPDSGVLFTEQFAVVPRFLSYGTDLSRERRLVTYEFPPVPRREEPRLDSRPRQGTTCQ
ncbi:hypothetical protein T261_8434 [Streptomyces lydicus]|nr:hypothetical protein T261_8434 [Streptomyces lydicus]